MAYLGAVQRWELYEADLEYVVGSEQGGERRPVLVVSNDGFNARFPVITVLPLTKQDGKQRKPYVFEVLLETGAAGNRVDSIVMPQQIRTISKTRLLGPALGSLTDFALQREIEDKMLQHLDIALDMDVDVDDEAERDAVGDAAPNL